MARQPGPKWHKAQKLWYARVGERGENNRRKAVYMTRPVGDPAVEPPRGKADEAQAWRWLEAFRAETEARKVLPGDPSVRALCELYLEWAEGRVTAGEMDPAHYAARTHHLGHLCRYAPAGAYPLGSRRARELTHEALDAAVRAWKAEGYTAHYVRNIVASVLAAFHWAARPGSAGEGRRLMADHPLEGYRRPSVPHAPERFAERSEAAAFLRFWRSRTKRGTVGGRYARLTILLERCLVHTGARPKELCTLRWGDIKWEAGTTEAGHAFAKATIPPERWKTGKKTGRPRMIYFSPALSRALKREHDRPGRHPWAVFVHGRGRGGVGAGEPWPDGSTLAKTVRRVRREAITAGIQIQDTGHQRLTNYRWRHTAASTLLMMGVDVSTVAELLGTSEEMIRRHYGHLLDKHLAAAAEKLTGARSNR
jgi:integrase